MKKQFTVDTLRRLLNQISAAGYGDAEIFIGESYPLMDDSVVSDLYNNKVKIRNTYYDKKMAKALHKASSDMAHSPSFEYVLHWERPGYIITTEELHRWIKDKK